MGDAAGRRAPGRRRPRDAGAGHRRAGRGRLRRGVGHPVPRGHRPQPLRRPDVHPAVARRCASGASTSSSTRCARSSRGKRLIVVDDSIVRGTTTKQIVGAAAQGRRRARSTSGSAPRRSTTRASTGSTPRSRPSSSPSTHSVEEIRDVHRRRLARLPVDRAACSPRSTCRTTGSASPASTATTRSRSRTTPRSRKFMLEEADPASTCAAARCGRADGRG